MIRLTDASTANNAWRRRLATTASGALLTLTVAAATIPVAHAVPEDEPSASEMVGDLLVARPLGAAITVLGTAAFVVSLPFSALGGNISQAADTLVLRPARETFVRCLGCKSSGRLYQPAE